MTKFFKILKFFILSRFTKGFILLTLAFSLLMLLFYLVASKLVLALNLIPQLRLNVLEFMTFFLIFNIFSSIVQKADFDFLLTSPIKRSTLVLVYMLGSLLVSGSYFIVLSTVTLYLYKPPLSYLAFISLSLFGLSVNALTIARNKLPIILFLIFLVWLPYLHVYYSPTSLFFNHFVEGVVSSLLLSSFLFYYSVSKAELQLSESKGRRRYRRLVNKKGIVSYMLSTYEFVWGYGTAFSGRRLFFYVVPFYEAFSISLAFSLVYLLIEVLLRPPFYSGIVAPNVLIVAFLSTTGIYSLSQERPWLTFMSLEPKRYLALKITIKTIQTGLLSLPFSLADIALGKTSMGLSLLGGVLLGYLLTSVLMSKLNPIQFRAEVYNYRASSGMILVIIADYVVITLTVILGLSLISSTFYLLSSLVLIAITYLNRKMWEKIGFNLVEKGFQ